MIPATLATIYVMFLYWQTNASQKPSPSRTPVESMNDEIAAINAQLAGLRKKLKIEG